MVTPFGNPATLTFTGPENPLTGDTDNVTGLLEPPGETERPDGETKRLKSGEAATFKVRMAE